MRVVAGTLRGRSLKGFKGRDIRPTSDKVKEAIFSSLLSLGFFAGSPRVLDLYAGTGALGIEALSRGAVEALFVDSSRKSAALINENIADLGLVERATVVLDEAERALRRFKKKGVLFDIIFMDPPYAAGLIDSTLEGAGSVLDACGVVVVEGPKGQIIKTENSGLALLDKKIYGDTTVFFIGRE